MTTHTPGPWIASASPWMHGANSDWYVSGPQSQGICQPVQYVGQPEESDARLIAAAPDLLAAREQLLAESGISPNGNAYIPGLETVAQAQDAIAKAVTL